MQDKLITSSHLPTDLEDLIQKANDLIRAAKAPTLRFPDHQPTPSNTESLAYD
jgi:hypothetical protein